MKLQNIIALILSMTLLGLTSCHADGLPTENVETKNIQQDTIELDYNFKNDVLNFSIDLFKNQVQDNQNIVISPQSLYFALGMVINGANGNTQRELKDVLYKDITLEQFNYNISSIINHTDNDIYKIANSIWLRNDLSLNETFKTINEKYFQSEIYQEVFDSSFVDNVNNWVSRNTDSMIDSILNEPPTSDTLMYLINAVCFEAKWKEKYKKDQIKEDTFTNSEGVSQNATMLYSTESLYINDDKSTGFLKYYTGSRYVFMGILPNEDVSISDYMKSFTGSNFENLYNSKKFADVDICIPEFTYSSEYNLNDTLQSMGIVDAFSLNADFSTMIDNIQDVYINNIIQKAYIQVDRNGTKASAVSSVEVNRKSIKEYYKVYLNRPFIYAIVDTQTELPVFMGIVNSINKN